MDPGRLTPGEHDRNPEHFRKATVERDPAYWKSATRGEVIHGAGFQARDEQTIREDMACYYGMTSFMDHEIGRILDSLERSGRAADTLVVFTSDHGHFLGQHGLIAKAIHMYEDLIRVPLIVRWPGHVPAGAASADLQNLVDLAPTFLAAAGGEVPGTITGRNQSDSWAGRGPVRTETVVENHHGTEAFHMRTLVTTTHKMTVYRDGEDGELFDLVKDPGEIHNLWHEPAAAVLKSELLHRFVQAILRGEPMRMPRIAGA